MSRKLGDSDTDFVEPRPIAYLEAMTMVKCDFATWVKEIDISPALSSSLEIAESSKKRLRSPTKTLEEGDDEQTGKEPESKKFKVRERIADRVDDDDEEKPRRTVACSACDRILFKPFHCGKCLDHAYCNLSCQRAHWYDMGHSKECGK